MTEIFQTLLYACVALIIVCKPVPSTDARAFNIKVKHWMIFFKVILLMSTVMFVFLKLGKHATF